MDRPSDAQRARPADLALGRTVYAVAVLACAVCLFGSIGLQLFGATEAHDGARPHRHQVFCEGQLWHLRRELQEAAATSYAPAAPRAVRLRRRAAWQTRLAQVTARCQNLPAHSTGAEALAELGVRYAAIDDAFDALATGAGAKLDAQLSDLR